MILNYIKIFIYHLRQNKLFSFLNVLGLSIGIAGLIFAILFWNDENSYNDWNPEKKNVFQVINYIGENMYWSTNIVPIDPYLKQMPEIEEHCYLNGGYYSEVIEYNGKKEMVSKILDSQGNFFSFFPFKFIKGNGATALKNSSCIALSEETAQRLFGNANALGKQVHYAGKILTVNGVYKIPGKSSFAPMAVTSLLGNRMKEDIDKWGNFSFALLLKLKDPEKAPVVKKKIENLYYINRTVKDAKEEGLTAEQYEKKYGATVVYLEPLESARLHSITNGYPEGRGNYQFLMIMMGLSLLILILSIVNYINLATANAIKRAKEVGVRKIMGATKGNIISQFIFETIIISLFSILLSLAIVELSLPYYNDFLNKELIIHGRQFYVQLIVIFITVILFSGIFPAIYVSDFETLKVLKGNFGRSKSGVWLRNGMLVLQFAIASFFIIGSYIVYQQIHYMSTKDLGFKGEQVLSISYRNQYNYNEKDYVKKLITRYSTIKQELLKIKGVQQVSAGTFSFGNGATSSSSFLYKDVNIQGENMAVDFGMLELMQIKLAKGRYFSEQFSSDTINTMMVNETALRMMKEKNPIGKFVNWNDNQLKIIGIVKDFHINGPQNEIQPMAFFHFKTINWMAQNLNTIYVKADPETMGETIKAIEKLWSAKVDTKNPFQYDFVDKSFARTYYDYVKQKNLFSVLNIIVILIALFGLFSLASYSIERRMKEIAIRKTLGAETHVLLKELSKQYIIFCVIGFLTALFPAYYLLHKWLENFAYRIDISFYPFLVGFVSLLLLTLSVVLSRAYYATKVDVLKYLKYE